MKLIYMDVFLTKDIKNKITGLAYYQIAGGIIGLLLLIWYIAHTVTITGIIILVFILTLGLYSFSIYCGNQLLKGKISVGLKLSQINQSLQILNIAILGYAFKYVAGLILSVGIDYTNEFKFILDYSLSEFQFRINKDITIVTVGINLVAVFLVYFIGILQQEVEKVSLNSKELLNKDTITSTLRTEEKEEH